MACSNVPAFAGVLCAVVLSVSGCGGSLAVARQARREERQYADRERAWERQEQERERERQKEKDRLVRLREDPAYSFLSAA